MILQILKDWALISGGVIGCIGGFCAFVFGAMKLTDWVDNLKGKLQFFVISGIFLVITLGFAIYVALNPAP